MTLQLSNQWKLYYSDTSSIVDKELYMNNFIEIVSFKDVETFFQMLQFCQKPSQLQAEQGYHLCKDDIKPTYEDLVHKNNNVTRLRLNIFSDKMDELWDKMVELVVRNIFRHPSITCVEIKKKQSRHLCAIWLIGNKQQQEEGIDLIKSQLNLRKDFELQTQPDPELKKH